jgi:hypothetical protein
MATSQINLSGKLNLVNNQTIQFPLQFIYTTSGSNFVANSANISTGSWQVVDQGNNSDLRLGAFTNMDASASIYLGIGGTGSFSVMQPGDDNLITFTGSTVLWAMSKGAVSSSFAVLNYLVFEK